MKFIFKDTEFQTELILPITPELYTAGRGIGMEIVNIHSMGDVALAGTPTLADFTVDCMFPAQNYYFCVAEPLPDPYEYLDIFRTWCMNKTVLRFIISDTPINVAVRVEYYEYGERDGSGDVYASITLREYRPLAAVTLDSPPEETPVREDETMTVTEQTHVVVWGDTLWAICRKYYGDPTLCLKLAAFNNIANPNLIYVGDVIRIPPIDLL